MADYDMPAKDASRVGLPAGWRLLTASLELGRGMGYGVEGYADGKRLRNAVRAPHFAMAAPVLRDWIARNGVSMEGVIISRPIPINA
jgi:hypothetical protein